MKSFLVLGDFSGVLRCCREDPGIGVGGRRGVDVAAGGWKVGGVDGRSVGPWAVAGLLARLGLEVFSPDSSAMPESLVVAAGGGPEPSNRGVTGPGLAALLPGWDLETSPAEAEPAEASRDLYGSVFAIFWKISF